MTTDLHSHVIPGVDDGAADDEAAREALRALVRNGIGRAIATPHLLGSLTLDAAALAGRLAELDRGWARLQAIAREFDGLELARGAEVMLDVPEPELSNPLVRLGGGSAVLVEFPFLTVPPYATRPLEAVRAQGFTPLLAHPERYGGATVEAIERWREAGAYLQVNGTSLLGKYGDEPRRIAMALLERGLVDCLSSDYHARGRSLVAEYRRLLQEHGAAEQAALLMDVNPTRVLAGEPPIPVGPLRMRRTPWTRILSAFRRSRRR